MVARLDVGRALAVEDRAAHRVADVARARAPSGTAVGQMPQATTSTFGAKRRLTRPSTPFCSWMSVGIFSKPAATMRRQRRIAAEARHAGRPLAAEVGPGRRHAGGDGERARSPA